MEEICWVTPTPLKASFKSTIPYAKSNTQSAHKDNPESKIVLSSLFWGTKSLHHRSRLRKRFLGVTPTPLRVSFKSPISCTKSSTRSVHKDSPVSEKVLFLFSRDQVCITDQDWGGDLLGDTNPFMGQLKSLGQSQTPNQHMKTAQCPKQFFFPSLFGNQVFVSQIKTKEEIVWATLLLCVSFNPSLLHCLIPESD